MDKAREINLKELALALLQKWWLIVACAVVGAVIAFVYTSQFVTPLYQAEIMVYVNNTRQPTTSGITSSDLATSQKLVDTYVNILKSDRVLDKVAESLDNKVNSAQIRGLITAASVNETEVFRVRVIHSHPEQAQAIANAIADIAPAEIENIVDGSSTKIIDRAKLPTAPVSPNKTRNTAVGLAGGVVVAVMIVVLSVLLDVRIQDEEDLAQISNAPVLGNIPDLAAEYKDGYRYGNKRYGYGYKYANNTAGKVKETAPAKTVEADDSSEVTK